jgi:hypothetical protein
MAYQYLTKTVAQLALEQIDASNRELMGKPELTTSVGTTTRAASRQLEDLLKDANIDIALLIKSGVATIDDDLNYTIDMRRLRAKAAESVSVQLKPATRPIFNPK